MTYRIEKKKWILYRHTNNFDLITAVAVNLKYFSKASISKDDKLGLLLKLKDLAYYKERNPELPLDSINHRINTLAYYMFGYKDTIDGQDRFLFSPLGNLFLKHIDNKQNLSKIFFTMLWGIQFEHPHGGSDKIFNLYPFRLIFKLLSDERIENRLYAYEVSYLLVFIESIDNQNYEKLINEILKIRKWSNAEIEKAFKEDEHTYVNSAYEWDYYVSELFQNAGVVEKTEGEVVCRLLQGKSTYRKITRNFVTLNPSLKNLCQKLMGEYPFDEKPLQLDDPERLKIDVVKQIYNFYPQILLEEIGEKKDDLKYGLLNLAKLIEQYSNNNEGAEAYLFEDILTDGFNMFVNVEAKKIGGAGNADLECLYITKKKKFAVDAKSTKNKLSGLNAGRLAEHRTKIGGEYTIVVTPRYVPAVLHDIKSAPIVIIRASTFSEYLYNHIDNEVREIDYADFDNIIVNNLGKDISRNISTLTIDKFSVKN
ncbi:MAG: restriction endonuclease [Candidatus Levybacteria bacterium]|nr:restriction endonuclease [Candidatus Levybacteria bacterium]